MTAHNRLGGQADLLPTPRHCGRASRTLGTDPWPPHRQAGRGITTLGPGALNLCTAAAFAHLGAMPMVMITGQKGILSSRQARFQIVDIVAAMKPLTKLAHQIVSTGTIPTLVREAFRVAQEERPGPVLLELPEDIAGEECQGVKVEPVLVGQHQWLCGYLVATCDKDKAGGLSGFWYH